MLRNPSIVAFNIPFLRTNCTLIKQVASKHLHAGVAAVKAFEAALHLYSESKACSHEVPNS